MKIERTSEEERYGNYYPPFVYNNIRDNVNEDFYRSIDFHTSSNNVSRVDYSRDFDEEYKSTQLLNLDAQNQRKACDLSLDYPEESCNNKSFFRAELEDEIEMNVSDSWTFKNIEQWNKHDTTKWYFEAAWRLGESYSQLENALVIPGKELLKLSRQEFIKRDPNFGGALYDSLHKWHRTKNSSSLFNKFKSDDESSVVSSTNFSDGESMSGNECVKKRPPGRPRIQNPKVKPVKVKLWEFVRNMLLDPRYCPELIRWVDYKSKRFCFVKSDQVAKLWGKRKHNTNMTYEKFSRAMRYYYEKNIFKAVIGRRLVYEFGEEATGLETDNPNFVNSV